MDVKWNSGYNKKNMQLIEKFGFWQNKLLGIWIHESSDSVGVEILPRPFQV